MYRLWTGIALAAVLVVGLVAVVASQSGPLGRLQPLLIDVEQNVPVYSVIPPYG
jgi:hypothetical protein